MERKTQEALAINEPIGVVMIGINNPKVRFQHKNAGLTPKQSMDELGLLCETLGYTPLGEMVQERDVPDPATYLGKGKTVELKSYVLDLGASLIVVDGALSPVQARNIQEVTGVAAIDRTELILRIFASRAMTKEGKLQVDLAAAQYALGRLTGHGADMSALGGGIGTRGPGEQRLEQDRRLARNRIARLRRELKEVQRVRALQRKRRIQSGIPLVSLVGYTNAGKSTLFTALTGEETLRDDRLFATLDPWVRKWQTASGQVLLLSDTVGFIQGLPHQLVAAFKATLENSLNADVLVHVVDVSSPTWEQQMATVEGVLSDLEAQDVPVVTCFNKSDRLDPENTDFQGEFRVSGPWVLVSALERRGLPQLEEAVTDLLADTRRTVTWDIPYSLWDITYEIKRLGTVLEEDHHKKGATVTCSLSYQDANRLARKLRIATNAAKNDARDTSITE